MLTGKVVHESLITGLCRKIFYKAHVINYLANFPSGKKLFITMYVRMYIILTKYSIVIISNGIFISHKILRFTSFLSTQYSYYEQRTATLQYIIFLYTAILSHVHNPLTVHIINISNPLRSEGILLVEAVTSFIGGS